MFALGRLDMQVSLFCNDNKIEVHYWGHNFKLHSWIIFKFEYVFVILILHKHTRTILQIQSRLEDIHVCVLVYKNVIKLIVTRMKE